MYVFYLIQFLKNLLKKGETIKMIGAMCEQYETDRDKCATNREPATKCRINTQLEDDDQLEEVISLIIINKRQMAITSNVVII